MSEVLRRRHFLVRMWGTGIALLAGAATWTTWDLLKPLPTAGFGGASIRRNFSMAASPESDV